MVRVIHAVAACRLSPAMRPRAASGHRHALASFRRRQLQLEAARSRRGVPFNPWVGAGSASAATWAASLAGAMASPSPMRPVTLSTSFMQPSRHGPRPRPSRIRFCRPTQTPLTQTSLPCAPVRHRHASCRQSRIRLWRRRPESPAISPESRRPCRVAPPWMWWPPARPLLHL